MTVIESLSSNAFPSRIPKNWYISSIIDKDENFRWKDEFDISYSVVCFMKIFMHKKSPEIIW